MNRATAQLGKTEENESDDDFDECLRTDGRAEIPAGAGGRDAPAANQQEQWQFAFDKRALRLFVSRGLLNPCFEDLLCIRAFTSLNGVQLSSRRLLPYSG